MLLPSAYLARPMARSRKWGQPSMRLLGPPSLTWSLSILCQRETESTLWVFRLSIIPGCARTPHNYWTIWNRWNICSFLHISTRTVELPPAYRLTHLDEPKSEGPQSWADPQGSSVIRTKRDL